MEPAEEVVTVGDKQIRLVAKRTKSACVNCKAAKVGCGNTRPCMWCIRHGIEATCVEAPKKARKPRTLKRKLPDPSEDGVNTKSDVNDNVLPNTTQTLVPYTHILTHPTYPAPLPTSLAFPQLSSSLSSIEIDPSLLELMYSSTSDAASSSIFNPHLTLDQLMEMAGADDEGSPENINNYITNNNNSDINNSNINNVIMKEESADDGTPSSSYASSPSSSPPSSSPPSINTLPHPAETYTNNNNNNINNYSNNNNMNNNNMNNNHMNNCNNFNMPQTGSPFINNMLSSSIMGSIFSNGASSPNFGGVIFNELAKIQKAVETITILTQIQQQLNGSNLATNTLPYPIALFSSVDPVVILQCNAAFAQMLGYHDINDAIMTRLDRFLPGPFQGFALRRIKKTGATDVPKKLNHIVFQSQTGDMIICVAVIRRVQSAGCLMAITKHTRASPELRTEMRRFVDRVGVLNTAVHDYFHFRKSIKTGAVRNKAPHEKDGSCGSCG